MASFDEVKRAASGRWSGIIAQLCGPHLTEAMQKYGDPVDCPVCLGTKKFRLFDKPGRGFEETGGCICNECGSFHDGLKTIAWLRGFPETDRCITARNEVADLLRLSDVQPLEYRRMRSQSQSNKRRSSSHLRLVSSNASATPSTTTQQDTPPESFAEAPNAKSMWATWRQTVDVMHPSAAPMRRYLVGRKLPMSKDLFHQLVLRFHPQLDYFERDEKSGRRKRLGAHPAMMALLLRPNGTPACLHRTYLTPSGSKADLPEPKKLWNCFTDEPLSGSAIRLYSSGKILGVTEGIETALAVRLATGMPVWATFSAMILPEVYIPKNVETVVIWADKDRSEAGELKALELKQRLIHEGRVRCEIAMPDQPIPKGAKGLDWADLWFSHGPDLFPFRPTQPENETVSTTKTGAQHAYRAA